MIGRASSVARSWSRRAVRQGQERCSCCGVKRVRRQGDRRTRFTAPMRLVGAVTGEVDALGRLWRRDPVRSSMPGPRRWCLPNNGGSSVVIAPQGASDGGRVPLTVNATHDRVAQGEECKFWW
jgi:hypothetical protein